MTFLVLKLLRWFYLFIYYQFLVRSVNKEQNPKDLGKKPLGFARINSIIQDTITSSSIYLTIWRHWLRRCKCGKRNSGQFQTQQNVLGHCCQSILPREVVINRRATGISRKNSVWLRNAFRKHWITLGTKVLNTIDFIEI